jgi:hypothetical protein
MHKRENIQSSRTTFIANIIIIIINISAFCTNIYNERYAWLNILHFMHFIVSHSKVEHIKELDDFNKQL